jgi:hypothetical protein
VTELEASAAAQLRAALEELSDRVWQQAGNAQLPEPVAQYFWTNFPGKISEAGLVLACITPDERQADAVREVSQRGDSDVLPILQYVESSAGFEANIQQEARTARQRITARLGRKASKLAASAEPAEMLDNYAGFVCAAVEETVVERDGTGAGSAGAVARDTIVVWLEAAQPAGTGFAPIVVRDGQDREEVLFDILLDSDEATIRQPRHALACRPGAASGKLRFGATADAGHPRVYWVNVFQKNRLIQILEISATNTETENRDDSEGSDSLH